MKTKIIIALLLSAWTVVRAEIQSMDCADGNIKSVKVESVDKMTISKYHFPSWMVEVQGGSYKMGSDHGYVDERPVHEVTVGDFYMSKFEVTQSLWKTIMGSNPSAYVGKNIPVEYVTWYDCIRFCNAINRYMGLSECYVMDGDSVYYKKGVKDCFRLPTEAEWEYAARGGHLSHGYLYSGGNNLSVVAWYKENCRSHIQTVGMKKPNELGLYDMSGNVQEYCWDEYGPYPNLNQDSLGRTACNYKVARGGSCMELLKPIDCSVTSRAQKGVNGFDMDSGMRLVFVGDTSQIGTLYEIPSYVSQTQTDTIQKMLLDKSTFPQWMVKVEGGKYTLGSLTHATCEGDRPKHTATLSSYFISQYVTTCGMWAEVMKTSGAVKDNNYPKTNITFLDCVRFCNALSLYYGYKPCYRIVKHKVILLNHGRGGFRIPTEDEWECAARGGQKSRGYKFSGSNNLRKVAWCYDNSGGAPHDVGLKLPNELGLYDMTGNVWEMCWTQDNDYFYPTMGCSVLCRLNDWYVEDDDSCAMDTKSSTLGFRLVFQP